MDASIMHRGEAHTYKTLSNTAFPLELDLIMEMANLVYGNG